MLEAELLTDVEALEGVAADWDGLAAANGLPQMTPAWALGWLRHVAPPGVAPRVVVVRDGERVVGIAPFFADAAAGGRVDYRIPNIQMSARLSPLAEPGRERAVGAAVARVLAGRAVPRPDIVAFEGAPLDSPWPQALRDGWPARLRPPLRRYVEHPCPSIAMAEGSFDDWLAAKSSNFRQQMRRARRAFEKAGGEARASSAATLHDDVATFARLHGARWEGKDGESNLVGMGDRLAPMLEEVGRSLGPERFRLWTLELDGEPVASLIFLVAGGHALYFNCGWDERFAKFKPAMLGLLVAVEDAFARGDRHIDLGLGEEPYKLRFADGGDPVAWTVLLVPGRRLPLSAARMAPTIVRAALADGAKRHLPEDQLERLRALRRRFAR